MRFFLFSLLLILAGLGTGFFIWRRERRYLHKKTSETMSPSLWREIVQERESALRKRRTFREILDKTQKNP